MLSSMHLPHWHFALGSLPATSNSLDGLNRCCCCYFCFCWAHFVGLLGQTNAVSPNKSFLSFVSSENLFLFVCLLSWQQIDHFTTVNCLQLTSQRAWGCPVVERVDECLQTGQGQLIRPALLFESNSWCLALCFVCCVFWSNNDDDHHL